MDTITSHIYNTPRWLLYTYASIALFALALWRIVIYPKYFSPLRKVPGPPYGHWLWGQMGPILATEAGVLQMDWARKYGEKGVVSAAGPVGLERLMFLTPSAYKKILVDEPYDYPKPAFVANVLGQAAGYGLLTVEGKEHKDMRRFMNPAFSMTNLIPQFDVYYGPIGTLVDLLKEEIARQEKPEEGAVVDCYEWVSRCLLDIICLTAFGYEVDSLNNPKAPLAVAYHDLINLQSGPNLGVLFILLSLPFGPRIATWLNDQPRAGPLLQKIGRATNNYTFRVAGIFSQSVHTIKQISRQLLKEKVEEAEMLGTEDIGGAKKDIMSLIVRANLAADASVKMNQKAMEDQVLTFLGAGHETTASGVTWTLHLLALNQHAQAKLRAECQELVTVNATPDYRAIKELKYLDCVVHESLRVRPPVPATMRKAGKSDYVDGVWVPKGTYLYIANRVVNTDPRVWGEDSYEFKPERWLDLPKDYNNTFSLMSFIAGAHACIGRAMSILEMKATICTLVANFEFHLAEPGQKVAADSAITMKPRDGLPLLIKRCNPIEGEGRKA